MSGQSTSMLERCMYVFDIVDVPFSYGRASANSGIF